MKTKEQIELAQDLIKDLQDYTELAKVEKKLKLDKNKESTGRLIADLVEEINDSVGEL